jgi:hypothetical protein
LSTQQITPLANQLIEQVTPNTGYSNDQGSTEERTTPNLKAKILEERPLETPAEIQPNEQVATELKSHMK